MRDGMRETSMTWLDAGNGYQVRLTEAGKVVCRNAKGKTLASVPSALKDDPEVVRLRQLAEWLQRHRAECRATVDRWMVRSLPVATAVLAEAWPDPAWAEQLRDLVVVAGEGAEETVGFLREADFERGVGLVTLDGDTRRLNPDTVRVPHPVLLADLEELREFGAELGVDQQVQQLFRQTFARPAGFEPGATSVSDYAQGKFEQLNHAVGRCRTLGYQVKGGYVVCPVFEAGRTVEARFWIGGDYPEAETYTGELLWSHPDGTSVPLTGVGPVAWSEGMRMAASVYAGRKVEEAAA
jgi:hypothetical protein